MKDIYKLDKRGSGFISLLVRKAIHRIWLFIKTPYFLSIVVVTTIFLPIITRSGYLFALDMVFVPHISFPVDITSDYGLRMLISVASYGLPADILQKIILIGSVIIAVLTCHRLLRYISLDSRLKLSVSAIYLGSLMYVFNPFVYSRLLAGQYALIIGYALIPLFVLILLNFMRNISWQGARNLVVCTLLISVVSIHMMGLIIVITLPIIGLYTYRHRRDWDWWKKFLLRGVAIVTGFIVGSSYWIIPTFLGTGKTAEAISGFGSADYTAFATNTDNLGVLGNVLTMRGFWADSANLYITPEDVYSWWLIPLLLLGILLSIGIYKGWKALRGLTVAFLCIFVVAIILSVGISGSIFAPINEWLLANMPFFAGYREPQKFVAIVILVYAVFSCLGLQQVIEWLQHRSSNQELMYRFSFVTLLLPVACAPLMLWGFSGQLQSRHYPRDWYSINDYLKGNISKETKILALPWHMYMRFDFAGRVIANPMNKFFAPQIVMSGDPEFKSSSSYLNTDEQQTIKQTLNNKTDVSGKLREQGIQYILLAKEFDHKKYAYFQNEEQLTLIRDTQNLRLYKIEPGNME